MPKASAVHTINRFIIYSQVRLTSIVEHFEAKKRVASSHTEIPGF